MCQFCPLIRRDGTSFFFGAFSFSYFILFCVCELVLLCGGEKGGDGDGWLGARVAVNKHGRDSVEVLPVPIKQQRDHHNERWPWHNWDSSQRKPGGWSDSEGSEWGRNQKHNINTASILWRAAGWGVWGGTANCWVEWWDLNLNVADCFIYAETAGVCATSILPACIPFLEAAWV